MLVSACSLPSLPLSLHPLSVFFSSAQLGRKPLGRGSPPNVGPGGHLRPRPSSSFRVPFPLRVDGPYPSVAKLPPWCSSQFCLPWLDFGDRGDRWSFWVPFLFLDPSVRSLDGVARALLCVELKPCRLHEALLSRAARRICKRGQVSHEGGSEIKAPKHLCFCS